MSQAWRSHRRSSKTLLQGRYRVLGQEANRFFATNDLVEAKLVANEVGFGSLSVRLDPE
jgi:hypothetical protein